MFAWNATRSQFHEQAASFGPNADTSPTNIVEQGCRTIRAPHRNGLRILRQSNVSGTVGPARVCGGSVRPVQRRIDFHADSLAASDEDRSLVGTGPARPRSPSLTADKDSRVLPLLRRGTFVGPAVSGRLARRRRPRRPGIGIRRVPALCCNANSASSDCSVSASCSGLSSRMRSMRGKRRQCRSCVANWIDAFESKSKTSVGMTLRTGPNFSMVFCR